MSNFHRNERDASSDTIYSFLYTSMTSTPKIFSMSFNTGTNIYIQIFEDPGHFSTIFLLVSHFCKCLNTLGYFNWDILCIFVLSELFCWKNTWCHAFLTNMILQDLNQNVMPVYWYCCKATDNQIWLKVCLHWLWILTQQFTFKIWRATRFHSENLIRLTKRRGSQFFKSVWKWQTEPAFISSCSSII